MATARRAGLRPPDPVSLPRPRVRRTGALILAGALTVTTMVPIGIAWIATPAAHVFTGYVVIARDAFVYQALWRAGWQGAWLFHPLFSSEPQPGILIYPWYLFTGHLVGWLAGPVTYHLARLGADLALVSAVWSLARTLYRPADLRRWALVFGTLGGGVGLLVGTGAHIGPIALRPTEVLVSGSTVADAISMAPHLAWAGALLCWIFTACLRWTLAPRLPLLLLGLGACVGLELIYPQLCVLSLCTITVWAIGRHRRRGLVFAAAAAGAALPYLAYLAWAQARMPSALIGVGATAQVPFHFDVGDPIGFLILSHLCASALIVLALRAGKIRGDLLLPLAWIVVMTAFMFVPGVRSVVGRSYLVSSIPFGILAAAGMPSLLGRFAPGPGRRRAMLLVLAASSLFGIFSLVQPYVIASARLDPNAEYERRGEASLLGWLAPRSTPKDLVLTTYLDGVFVPAQTDARAYVGHPDQTVDAAAKAVDAQAFFDQWDPVRRDAFLDANRIDYVLARNPSTVARLLGDPRLRMMREADGEALFQVVT